ncbi:Calycin-like domain and Calycin domain-containing protein [Strongyloides ratti]|uniref:Calycin-like domain and Calycin domain-containing protein n=1 Tax=Strongyloides ratti TaxID=34506 RepID=A0A090LKB5_STRRB|nr:Calycin-like domain and Calycin domain-containing protein [Strongyloides ratti]CEF70212.1 Calycin-like domain and Calycin domain-containing protein [Strongyloides ratti]
MLYLHILLIILIFITKTTAKRAIVGIPVPGRTVPAYNIFNLYRNSCIEKAKNSVTLKNLNLILKHSDADALTERFYRNLFHAIGELDIEKLMGKWYVIIDTPSYHNEKCCVFDMKMIEKNKYTSSFSIKEYCKDGVQDIVIGGDGQQFGPDPGQILFHLNHPNDVCPYFLIKLGEINNDNVHEYMILSQPMKAPTIVLAREPEKFIQQHGVEIGQFLDKHGFAHSSIIPNATLEVTNFDGCQNFYNYDIVT